MGRDRERDLERPRGRADQRGDRPRDDLPQDQLSEVSTHDTFQSAQLFIFHDDGSSRPHEWPQYIFLLLKYLSE